MKLKAGILLIFLVIGLFGVPNCTFAQQYPDSSSNTVIKSDMQSTTLLNSLTPLVKGSGGGSKGGSSSSSKIHTDDADVSGGSGDDSGWNWMTIIIILVIILGIIGVLVWYFFLRK
ncbi:MAG TPA: hypothetical protein VK426_00860 [Methanobacterium sp.]|nr:hypothetical protein [Methanobacterium sp.]